jgi:hypothetical protein
MKIYKNFLDKEKFKQIQDILTSTEFPWYLNTVLNEKTTSYNHQLAHIFYANDKINSAFFNMLNSIKTKINWLTLLKVKANLLQRTDKIIEHGMHTDYEKRKHKIITGIFYINTNNGYTKFKNGEVIKSEENKYIEFDHFEHHTGTTCTDSDYRIIINFNYIK